MERNAFRLKNIKLNNNTLIKNSFCEITLFIDEQRISIPQNSFCFLVKGQSINFKGTSGCIPEFISISDEWFKKNSWLLGENISIGRPMLKEKGKSILIKENISHDSDVIFKSIKNSHFKSDDDSVEYLAYSLKLASILISFGYDILSTIKSLSKPTTSKKVQNIISENPSKQWKLEHISELMYISNVTLRKRLSAENKKFTQILLETRMNHALELLLTTDKNITTISRQVGYGSVSYFIKLFKEHYGETPKKIITQRIR